jgi:hypothetical protein
MPFKFAFILLLIIISESFYSQSLFFIPSDSLNKNRTIFTSVSLATLWSGSIFGLSQVWYKDHEKSGLHSFDDSKEWLQMDKAGHVFAAFHFGKQVGKLYRWSGLNKNKATWLGAGIGWGYQFSFELLDGTSKEWGFSWSDLTANSIGTGLYIAQELLLEDDVFRLKFSYKPTEYAQYRPSVLGKTHAERFLKDYNGQTYWLSIAPKSIFKNSPIPPWLMLSLGYSSDAKLVGDKNFYQTDDGLNYFRAKREFVFSLDIDPSKVPIKSPFLKKMAETFCIIKVPFPALLWRGNVLYGKWLYF